jgi:hypothetical protein
MKTSLFALAAAATLVATGASAADLGGNCCADLEERIAELEATTARKGNRKVKLTVSGWVHEQVMYWDDGGERNTYVFTGPAPTRFRFVGDAKISNDVTAGYLLEIGAYSALPGTANATGGISRDSDEGRTDLNFQVRHSAWWLAHKQLGKLWVGQTSQATDSITEINLANTGMFTAPGVSVIQVGAFSPRTAANVNSGILVTNFFGGAALQQIGEGERFNVIKYETPTIAGFTGSAAFGEDDMWDIALRYAGEHHGFKLAAGIGYQEFTDGNVTANAIGFTRGCVSTATNGVTGDVKCSQVGLSASIMHLATGLYVTGAYGHRDDDRRKEVFGVDAKKGDTMWYLQAGIEQNWLGFGKTTLFGEYLNNDQGHITAANGALEGRMWGLGINQAIDAAAMNLYMVYRDHSFDQWGVTATGGQGVKGAELQDIRTFTVGGNIQF